MPNSTTTTNMGLIVPTVAVDPGPDWANNINASLGILDQHNHSNGQGVQITPSGININADLPMNANNLTLVNTVNFKALLATLPGSSPNLGCIYVAGNELIYNDEAGNVVPITKTGSVNAGAGSITGLPSGTASASYSSGSGTFVWQSATNTPANMDFGSAILRNIAANSKGLTLSPPSSLSSDYSATFLPTNGTGSTVFVTYDSSNNMGLGPNLTAGINTTNIADGAITQVKLAASPKLTSSSSGAFTTGNTSYTNITNMGGSLTTTAGRVVYINFISDGLGSIAQMTSGPSGAANTRVDLQLVRNAAVIAIVSVGVAAGGWTMQPPTFVDTGATTGSTTYQLQGRCHDGGAQFFTFENFFLVAVEI